MSARTEGLDSGALRRNPQSGQVGQRGYSPANVDAPLGHLTSDSRSYRSRRNQNDTLADKHWIALLIQELLRRGHNSPAGLA